MTISYWDDWCTGAVNLVDYCNIVGFWECAFFGVNNPADTAQGCRRIWNYQQRKIVARYLCEAQEEIENELNYPLIPTWFTNEEHDYRRPMVTKWGKVINGGIQAETDISLNQAVTNIALDPLTFGPAATTVTNVDEIKVYYPGTDFELIPSAIVIAGGFVTITIPKCRAVGYALLDTPEIGLVYATNTNFQATVDIKRVYNDVSTQAELVDPHNCGNFCSLGNCSEYTHTGCIYVRNHNVGIIDAVPGTYSGGSWIPASCSKRYSLARINYYAGLNPITKQLQDAVVRLAHTKMPQDPCGCDPISYLWNRDNNVPDVLSKERVNCPFGMSDGAWTAFQWAKSKRLIKMEIL